MIEKIKINYEITGTKIVIPFKSICSIINKPFNGNIILEYRPQKTVIEYVSLEKFIKEITKEKATAEELTHKVFKAVNNLIQPKYLKVTIPELSA